MKKKYLIVAITAFSFLAGVSNSIQAQDTTLSLGKYLTKTPWILTYGPDFIDNDGKKNPFEFNPLKAVTPFKFAFEKDIYGFRGWKYAKGLSLVGAFTSTGLNPHKFFTADGYLKYDLNALIGDTKFFDPNILIGAGYTYSDFHTQRYSHVVGGVRYKNVRPAGFSQPDNAINFNVGLGFNIWVFKNVGINFQSVGKFAIAKKKIGGANYIQHSIGMVINFGGGARPAEMKPAPVSTYKRSKEAEDALIHLREHINK